MDVHAPAQIITARAQLNTAPAQLITAPAQPPMTGVAVYTALLFSYICHTIIVRSFSGQKTWKLLG